MKTHISAMKSAGIAGLAIIGAIAMIIPLLTTDIVINRGYLAGKDFEKAFDSRLTGNCDKFMEYIATDNETWKERCLSEKSLASIPFFNFDIKRITVAGDRAFIQSEMTRGSLTNTYMVTYEMILRDGRWMINQPASK
ncbi:MAG: nuclear transport factor 2 family protein [Candidatus Colwellbacteria bacterium]|nr:nuclear transport factor 2 family protein [Candidatus Colwellbacteria bacterium]